MTFQILPLRPFWSSSHFARSALDAAGCGASLRNPGDQRSGSWVLPQDRGNRGRWWKKEAGSIVDEIQKVYCVSEQETLPPWGCPAMSDPAHACQHFMGGLRTGRDDKGIESGKEKDGSAG